VTPAAPDLATVRELLAGFGDREAGEVGEELGSLELTWLIAQFEQAYAVVVDLEDAELARIETLEQAANALRAVLGLPALEARGSA
jgi:acyl carrier protein